MQIDLDKLKQYEKGGLLRSAVHPSMPLTIWTYSQQTVYERNWDEITLMCRGLITDPNGLVISRPFPKFFNWGEPLAPGPEIVDGAYYAYDKMDGSLIIVGKYEGELVVSTKGSFTTWHSEKAAEYLRGFDPHDGLTGIFEFIDPANRIVVDYGDYSGVILLGCVKNDTGEDHFKPDVYAEGTGWWGDIVVERKINLVSALRMAQEPEAGPNREGFVMVWPVAGGPSHRVKIKFSQYIHLHSVLTRLTNISIWESLKDGTFEELLEIIPDEMYDKVEQCAVDIAGDVYKILADSAVVAETALSRFDNRKDQAAHILAHAEHSAVSFLLMDGKNEQANRKAFDLARPTVSQAWTYLN